MTSEDNSPAESLAREMNQSPGLAAVPQAEKNQGRSAWPRDRLLIQA